MRELGKVLASHVLIGHFVRYLSSLIQSNTSSDNMFITHIVGGGVTLECIILTAIHVYKWGKILETPGCEVKVEYKQIF